MSRIDLHLPRPPRARDRVPRAIVGLYTSAMPAFARTLRVCLPALAGLGCVLVASCASPPAGSTDSADAGGGASSAQPGGRAPAEEPRPSIDGRWLVVAVERGGERLDAPRASGDDAVALEFSGLEGARSRVSGYGGVNRFSGTYSHSPGEMLVGAMWVADIISTKRAGPPEAMRFEDALLDVLGRARSFVFDDTAGLVGAVEAGGDRVLLRRR